MIDVFLVPPNPFNRAHSKPNNGYSQPSQNVAAHTQMSYIKQVWVPPNPLGRHPFNIITEEIYG